MELVPKWNFSVYKALVKDLIFLLGNLTFFPVPDCLLGVDKIAIQLDWVFVEDGVLANNLFNFRLPAKLN